MLKKSLIVGFGIFGLLFSGSLLFQSCKCEEKVCNLTFNAATLGGDSLNFVADDGIDTSLSEMRFEYNAFNERDNPACAWNSIGFSSAYAFTRYCEVANPIVEGSYVIRLNRDLRVNTDTIPAGTNLYSHPALTWDEFSEDFGKNNASIYGTITLDSTTYQQVQFDTGMYNVEFGFRTQDGQDLRQTLNVVYKL